MVLLVHRALTNICSKKKLSAIEKTFLFLKKFIEQIIVNGFLEVLDRSSEIFIIMLHE